jgi:hypothetical protein
MPTSRLPFPIGLAAIRVQTPVKKPKYPVSRNISKHPREKNHRQEPNEPLAFREDLSIHQTIYRNRSNLERCCSKEIKQERRKKREIKLQQDKTKTRVGKKKKTKNPGQSICPRFGLVPEIMYRELVAFTFACTQLSRPKQLLASNALLAISSVSSA